MFSTGHCEDAEGRRGNPWSWIAIVRFAHLALTHALPDLA
jgi:hypothetical protein